MVKSKSKSEVEHLRSENKKIKKVLKHLKRDVSRKAKRQQNLDELEDLAKEMITEYEHENKQIKNSDKCVACGRGKLDKVDLGIKYMYICQECKYRKTIKK